MEQLTPEEPRFASSNSVDAQGDNLMTLRGELDMSSAGALRDNVEQLVAGGCRKIVFDLDELSFMDSSGIAVLVFAANNIGDVRLINASSIIRRIIEATGLSGVLKLDQP
jgi:anti-sigma B factor antagonist